MYDGQMDDARLCLDTLLTSTIDNYMPGMKGSSILNYCKFQEFTKDPETNRITGGVIVDRFTGKEIKVNAKVVINATGVFSDSIRKMDDETAKPRIVASAGSHLTMPSKMTENDMGLIARTTDNRVIF